MAKDHPDAGKTLGYGKCSLCQHQVKVKVSVRGLPYYNCDTADDGCGQQTMARTADAQNHMVRQIDKWNDPEMRKRYLGDDALPAKARKKDDPPPEPEPEADPEESESDETPEAEAEAPPPSLPSQKPQPRKRAKPTPPPPKAAPVKLFGRWK